MIAPALGALAIVRVLVGIVPDTTKAKILDHGCPGKVESTICCVPDLPITFIQETPKYNDYLVSTKEFFIHRNISIGNIILIFTGASSGKRTHCWNYLIIYTETSIMRRSYVFACLPADCPVVVCIREYSDIDTHWSWLPTRIVILNFCMNRFVLGEVDFPSTYANPCPMVRDDIVMRDLGLLGNRPINLPHFFNLVTDGSIRLVKSNKGKYENCNSNIISDSLSGVFVTFFAAIGCALIMYGVNKSREVAGWSITFIILGGLCWFIMAFLT